MSRQLPKMYKNPISKKIDNVQKIYSSLNTNAEREKTNNYVKKEYSRFDIDKKIYNIFNSPDYVYKADVTIVTDKEVLTKRIIGKVKNQLITIDNEKIDIDTIKDIYK